MSDDPEKLPEGTLMSHLLELRDRLLRAFIAVLLVFMPCAYYANPIFEWLERPLQKELPKGATLIATSITSPFTTPFKLAFIVALLIAMPYVLYQIWAFVAPGLYRREKRFARPLLVSAILLFYCGAAFAYFIVFPIMFRFFVSTLPNGVQMMADITNYMDFVLVHAAVLRRRVRGAGGGGAAGDHGPGQRREAHHHPRLRGHRHLRRSPRS